VNKLGAVYNLFDGEELLEDSILSIRAMVDYICVVYQSVSNFGEFNNCEDVVLRLLGKGLIDYAYKYEPNIDYINKTDISWESGYKNELIKRNIGIKLCKDFGCQYMLMLDTDEFYTPEQFNYAYDEIVAGNYDTSFCQMTTYYKEPIYQLSPKESYYVPFIIKLKENTEYKLFNNYPLQIDQTRRTDVGNCIVFSRDEIEMHHFSYIRKDMKIKFVNSSSVFSETEINETLKHFNNFKIGNKALLLGNRLYDVVETKNIFNIKI
jgi:hypothetical protein